MTKGEEEKERDNRRNANIPRRNETSWMTNVAKRDAKQIPNAYGYSAQPSGMHPPALIVFDAESSSSAAGSRRWIRPVATACQKGGNLSSAIWLDECERSIYR